MKNEYELVDHSRLKDMKVFVVNLTYRNPHLHREFELCLVLQGDVEVYTQRTSYVFHQGSMILFNPRQLHEIHAVKKQALLLSLQISPKYCARFFPALPALAFTSCDITRELTEEIHRALEQDMLQLAIAYYKKKTHYEFLSFSIVNRMFYLLLNQLSWHTVGEDEKSAFARRVERLNRITSYIEEHFTEKLLLSDIAESEHLSLTYLSHFFKDNLNMSFQEYVNLLRFEKARQYVEQTTMCITDICITCGFSDYRYLNKIYMEQTGMTPKEYRKNRIPSDGCDCRAAPAASQKFLNDRESLQILSQYTAGELPSTQ